MRSDCTKNWQLQNSKQGCEKGHKKIQQKLYEQTNKWCNKRKLDESTKNEKFKRQNKHKKGQIRDHKEISKVTEEFNTKLYSEHTQ